MTALSGIRVLELGSTIAGPFCGRMLADFGADVIKIENPDGDVLRSFGGQYNDRSMYAASLLRNKRVISVDLRTDEGRSVLGDLVKQSDVIIENFRPGTLEKWGLGYEELKKYKQNIILARISGFGQTGPYSKKPGYGIISEAMSGLRSITGDPDRPPARVAMPLTDYLTGLYAAFGILLAIIERSSSDEGQVVDAALTESAMSLMESFIPVYGKTGEIPNRQGPKMQGAVPNNLYVTSDGEFVHIAAWADNIFRRLCIAMGDESLADDSRFSLLSKRVENEAELDEIIRPWVLQHDLSKVLSLMDRESVPASKIYNVADLFSDPQVIDRKAIIKVDSTDFDGDLNVAAPVPKLSRTPGKVTHLGRDIGSDTFDVLKTVAGYDHTKIESLINSGIVKTAMLKE